MGRNPSWCLRRAVLVCGAMMAAWGAQTQAAQREGTGWDSALLQAWVAAAERHVPGDVDGPLADVAAWSGEDLRRLWGDAHVLLDLVVSPRRTRFSIPPLSFEPPSRTRATEIRSFNRDERNVLDALAKRVRGLGLNAFLRRSAIVHTDVVTLGASIAARADVPTAGGPLRWYIGDGAGVGAEGQNMHWELARMVLFRVAPDPRHDTFVRDWYRATLATGQATEYFDALHLGHALRLFPDDPEMLLLAGAEHEAMATPLFQAFARSVQSRAVTAGISGVDGELSAAARYYGRALEQRSDFPEARVRLGRVLQLQGRHADSVRELRQALQAPLGPVYAYVATLFLGVALEGTGDVDGAIDAFRRAADQQPAARAPHLALARVARERGDRELMIASLERAMAPLDEDGDVDPWWLYRSIQGRRRTSGLDDVRRRARATEP